MKHARQHLSAMKPELSTPNQGTILSSDRLSSGWPLGSDGSVRPRDAVEPELGAGSIFDDVNGDRDDF
jgi:hypothetical protein